MAAFDRRHFLQAGVLTAGAALMTSRLAFASMTTTSRFVFIILRGALDGLAAVPPYADSDYVSLRRELAIGVPGSENGAIKLDNTFGLHPNLRFLGEAYAARELTVFHAVASPIENAFFGATTVRRSRCLTPPAGTLMRMKALRRVSSPRASVRWTPDSAR